MRIYTRIYASAPIFINENAMSEAKRIVPPPSLLRRTSYASHLGAKRGCLISLCVRCDTRRFGKKSKQSHYRSKRHLLSQRLSPRQSGDGLRSVKHLRFISSKCGGERAYGRSAFPRTRYPALCAKVKMSSRSLLRRTSYASHLGAKRGCLISLCVRCGTRRFGKKSKQSRASGGI